MDATDASRRYPVYGCICPTVYTCHIHMLQFMLQVLYYQKQLVAAALRAQYVIKHL